MMPTGGDSLPMTHAAATDAFSDLLKTWRARRRFSQLDLALEAGLSQRHISFLETGRSRPSREAIAQLGNALEIPAAEMDAMLTSAGFAARSGNARWSETTRRAVEASLDHVLAGHEPYPAVTVDRIWTIQKANSAALAFFSTFGGDGDPNVLRAVMKPGPLRESIVNWQDNARALLRLLQLEIARRPSDLEARDLLAVLFGYPGVAEAAEATVVSAPAPVLSLQFRVGGATLSLFSMIATIGMSADAQLDDLRIETLLPADEATRQWFVDRSRVVQPPR